MAAGGILKTNDLKAGTRVLLRNGWMATLKDSKKGNIRVAEVEGYVTEIGSIYAHDIIAATVGGKTFDIHHTDSQNKLRKTVNDLF